MKKVVLPVVIVLILLVGGFFAATWALGTMTQTGVSEYMEDLNEQLPGEQVSVSLPQYNRGFLKSSGSTAMTIDSPEKKTDLVLKHDIYHGPLAMTPDGVKPGMAYIVSTLDQSTFTEETREQIAKFWEGKDPLVVKTLVHLDGSRTSHIAVQPIDFKDEKGTIQYGGAVGDFAVGSDGRSISGKFHSTKFTGGTNEAESTGRFTADESSLDVDIVSGEKVNLNLAIGKFAMDAGKPGEQDIRISWSGLKGTIDQGAVTPDSPVFTGTAKFSIPDVSIDAGETGSMKLSAIEINSETKAEGELLLTKIDYGLDSMVGDFQTAEAKDPNFAIGQKLLEGGFHLGIGAALPIRAAEKLTEMQAALQTKSGSAPQLLDEEKDQIVDLLESVLRNTTKGTGINLDLLAGADANRFQIAADVTYDKENPITSNETYQELAQNTSVKITASLPKFLLPQTPETAAQYEMLVQSGSVIDKGTHYETTLSLENGVLLTNGNPNPMFQALAGPMLQQPINWDDIFSSMRQAK